MYNSVPDVALTFASQSDTRAILFQGVHHKSQRLDFHSFLLYNDVDFHSVVYSGTRPIIIAANLRANCVRIAARAAAIDSACAKETQIVDHVYVTVHAERWP